MSRRAPKPKPVRRPITLHVGDEIENGRDHGIITRVEGKAVWYRSRETDQVRRTVVGHCTKLPSWDYRLEMQREIREGWSPKERRSRLAVPESNHVDITEVSIQAIANAL